ncbi:GlsB/YeaQ/YmgE family stress response membrane protein [Actinomycetes bacterium KLBMP 9797]
MIGTIIWAIIAGAIIGMLGRLLLPGRQNISVWLTIGVGIAAALIGGVLADWLGVGETRGIDWIRHIIQVALAVLFVWIAARLAGGSTRRHTTA